MARPAKPATEARAPLSRERVLRAAVAFADESGIATLSMRKLGEVLGVEAMSLYNHVASKGNLLDGMIDLVFSEIDLPSGGAGWKTAMRQRAASEQTMPIGKNQLDYIGSDFITKPQGVSICL